MTFCEPQTEAEFRNFFDNAACALVIYGDASIHCNAMYEIFKIVASLNPLIVCIKADVNKLRTCAEVIAVTTLPTIVAIKNHVVVDMQVGACAQLRLTEMCAKLR